jgi:sulfide dehydrogenase [flavocytochrome c] flavoprotein chain
MTRLPAHRRGPTRRTILGGLAATALSQPAVAQGPARIVVIGGGFGGVSCARELKRLKPELAVTLVEPSATYTACPMSNAVIAGLRPLAAQRFALAPVERHGIALVRQAAAAVEVERRRVVLADGTALPYDRLVLAPGIEIRFDALPGYEEAAAERMPHAWRAGPQTELLARQLEAMPDGGTVVMSVPPNPYRCPPGPYERASLIAYHLKTRKPRSKLLVLDAKDAFSKQRLFQQAWATLYPGLIEYVPLAQGGQVTAIEPTSLTFVTEFGEHRADVGNVIPPQRAAPIARAAGVADRSGWCPVDPATFESMLQRGIHVIGDAAIMGAMPKSAFAANAQAKVCAAALVSLLDGEPPPEPRLINTCYSLVAPDYGISVAGVYRPREGRLVDIEGAGGTSPLEAPASARAAEAAYAEAWFETITREAYG